MRQTTIIRISGILFVLAFVGVMADALELAQSDLAIGTVSFSMLLGTSGMTLFLRRAAGWWVAGLGLVGVLLILVGNLFYPSDAFAWMFAIGTISVGLVLLVADRPARLASLVWLASGIMGLPPVPRVPDGAGFLLFGVALLVLGYLLWTEAGPREVDIA